MDEQNINYNKLNTTDTTDIDQNKNGMTTEYQNNDPNFLVHQNNFQQQSQQFQNQNQYQNQNQILDSNQHSNTIQQSQQNFNLKKSQQLLKINAEYWTCPNCKENAGFIDESDFCGVPCFFWWFFVPFGLCIYPCCLQKAHQKIRKCISCQYIVVLNKEKCCPC
ncbi:hypothetical protein PPERSA_10118 [Pseudocohnilembus persalinus]|uniref:LITAF domain-containing protein n=1 Tax=Pseudocohnilembus persalinus TaxID=266149 RepID=A0A0V0R0K8_PSEPJ|nr:hypothetical protein PPERSA_10118 [Pseudocohnilembus persalinus]|eukprot:KRX07834.1 hypothetical protein PPERSA_10118 [Pseudocohnilembus persalinus]